MRSLLHNRQTFEHPARDAIPTEDADAAAAYAKTNPFIYNPKKGPAAARSRPTVVQNEIAEVFVTLQNPFLFDLEIQSIELRLMPHLVFSCVHTLIKSTFRSTSGVPFACDPLSTTIPPGTFHTVRLSGTPREAGLLVVRGCNIRLAGCTSREFVLPVWSDVEEAKRQKAAMLDTSRDRSKSAGLVAFARAGAPKPGEDGFVFLECTVVPEMPLLWMRSTSLTHGALMLYDGEV